MFPGIGTIINVAAILLGALLGVTVGNRLKEDTRNLLTDILGSITIISAAYSISAISSPELISALAQGAPLLSTLASLLVGGIIGSVIGIEERINTFGARLKRRFEGEGESLFAQGFLASSLLFVIGPLAILGSISDGMSTGIEQLTLKSILDFFAALAFAAAFGWGVAFSALPVGIYQLFWTMIGFFLGAILEPFQVQSMTAVGGVLLLGIGLKLLRIKEMAIGNLLPALVIAPIFASLLERF